MSEGADKWMIVMGCGKSQVPFIRAASGAGFRVLGVDRDLEAPGREETDRFSAVSTFDAEAVLAAIEGLNIVGIIAYSAFVECQKAAAIVRERYHLVGPKPDALKYLLNKPDWQRKLDAAGVNTPKNLPLSDCSVIAKPLRDGYGSAGIRRFESMDAAKAELGDAFSNFHLEPFLDGELFNVGGVIIDGQPHILSVCRKKTLPNLVTSGFCSLNTMDPACSGLKHAAVQAITAFGFTDTPFSVDVIRSKDGDAVIDVGCLLDARVDRLLAAAEVPVYDYIVAATFAEKAAQTTSLDAGWALDFAFADREGCVSHLTASRGEVELERPLGSHVHQPTSIADCLGYCIFRYENGEETSVSWTIQIEDEAA